MDVFKQMIALMPEESREAMELAFKAAERAQRDQFAAAALTGLVDIHEHGLSKTVNLAYQYADAMMKKRKELDER